MNILDVVGIFLSEDMKYSDFFTSASVVCVILRRWADDVEEKDILKSEPENFDMKEGLDSLGDCAEVEKTFS